MKKCSGYKGNPCVVSDEPQPFTNFYKQARGYGGVKSICKACTKEASRLNKDVVNTHTRAWKAKNKSHIADYNRSYRENSPEKVKSANKNWRENNRPHKTALEGKRRASKLNATPEWLTKEHHDQIKLVYAHAKECELLTGDKYHVDHIVPLQGKNVSGLHVPWNLQVLPADINIKKSNSNGKDTF